MGQYGLIEQLTKVGESERTGTPVSLIATAGYYRPSAIFAINFLELLTRFLGRVNGPSSDPTWLHLQETFFYNFNVVPEAERIIARICLQAYLRRMKREEEQQKASSNKN